jgi:hypothetical protein
VLWLLNRGSVEAALIEVALAKLACVELALPDASISLMMDCIRVITQSRKQIGARTTTAGVAHHPSHKILFTGLRCGFDGFDLRGPCTTG